MHWHCPLANKLFIAQIHPKLLFLLSHSLLLRLFVVKQADKVTIERCGFLVAIYLLQREPCVLFILEKLATWISMLKRVYLCLLHLFRGATVR